jgi:hypothetical protein
MKSISPFRRAPRVVKRARRTQAGRHQGYEVGHVFEHVVGDNCLERVRSRDHFAEPPTRDAEAIVIELDRTQVENEVWGPVGVEVDVQAIDAKILALPEIDRSGTGERSRFNGLTFNSIRDDEGAPARDLVEGEAHVL